MPCCIAVMLGCFAAAAAALPPAERLAAFHSAYKTSGTTVDCIATGRIDTFRILDDRHIAFRLTHGDVALNTLPRPCPRLATRRTIAYAPTGDRLCAVDTITVVDTLGSGAGAVYGGNGLRPMLPPGPRCGLGVFELYMLADTPPR